MTQTATTTDVPAIAGGKPAKTAPFGKERRYGDEELAELREALDQGSLFYAHGKKTAQLERAFAERVGARHAVACSSGTAAIHAALMAVGISPGDEVITSPITDAGSVLPILWQGGVPVFADLDPRTYNLDPASVATCVTPRTRAILAVHLAGNACDVRALRAIGDRHKLVLIEDCAQAHGCTYEGKPVGTIGEVGCYSLNEFKHIACGDGGVVVTDDAALAKRLRLATDKAYDRTPGALRREATFLAANYRITELQSAVAIAQLRKLDSIIARRRSWCGQLSERLADVAGVQLPAATNGCVPSWWFYLMRVIPAELGTSADEFAAALKAEGLPVGAHYIGRPVYAYPVLTDHSAFARGTHPSAAHDYRATRCPTAEAILDTCVMLSVNEAYTDRDLDETAHAITRVAAWFRSRR
jgi:perosamine synthetase